MTERLIGKCSDCKFGLKVVQDRGAYDNLGGSTGVEMVECRRFPPSVEMNPFGNNEWRVFRGPTVELNFTCGEFSE